MPAKGVVLTESWCEPNDRAKVVGKMTAPPSLAVPESWAEYQIAFMIFDNFPGMARVELRSQVSDAIKMFRGDL